MSHRVATSEKSSGGWPNRMAWALACAALASIWLGANVTSYQAGMAIPDWPAAYGHWIWCPLATWWPAWDLRLDYGHRLSGRLVVVLATRIALAARRALAAGTGVATPGDRRRRWAALAVGSVTIVVVVSGGMRVVLASQLWAALHAGVAPWLFGLAAALVTLTSAAWRQASSTQRLPAARRLQRSSLAVTAAVYLLIVLGVLLRHLPYDGRIEWFELWVWLKLSCAGLTACGLGWLLVDLWRHARRRPKLIRRAQLLAALFFLQSILGAAAWVTHYEWPVWFTDHVWAIRYTVVAQGRLQVLATTTHVVVGSLMLGTSLALTLWSFREVAANDR